MDNYYLFFSIVKNLYDCISLNIPYFIFYFMCCLTKGLESSKNLQYIGTILWIHQPTFICVQLSKTPVVQFNTCI